MCCWILLVLAIVTRFLLRYIVYLFMCLYTYILKVILYESCIFNNGIIYSVKVI